MKGTLSHIYCAMHTMRTHLLDFVILRVQIKEITCYDEGVVFLVVQMDQSSPTMSLL